MKKVRRYCIFFLMTILLFPVYVQAQGVNTEVEEDYTWEILKEQIEELDLDKVENHFNTAMKEQDYNKTSLKTKLFNIIKGETKFSISEMVNQTVEMVFKEVSLNMNYLLEILIISVFCALLKNLSESFSSKSVSVVGFYACYVVLIILLIKTFSITIGIASNTIKNMKYFMDALIPTLITLMVTTGNITTASFFQPIILMSLEFITSFVMYIVIPGINLMMILSIVNNLAEKELLTKLIELLEQSIKWSLITVISIFFSIIAIQGITAPPIDGIGAKAAKFAVGNFIPIVGEVMADSMELILNCSLIIKNGIGVIGIILLITICFIPIIKIIGIMIVYKLSAALIQPISQENIVDCISQIGNSCGLMCACVVATTFMFVVAIAAMVGAGNITSMLR